MIASLFWKEYREHRSVWVAMALLAVISLTVATELILPHGVKAENEDTVGSVVGGGLILTAMYGLVCGAMMFAGERESRGMAYLDTLPMSRAELWWSKCLFGIIFVLIYSFVVVGTGLAVGVIGPRGIPAPWAVVVPMVGVEMFALGLCASTYCRTVLTAVAFAALLPVPILWLLSGMCMATSLPQEATGAVLPAVVLFHGLATLGALALSAGTFVDRDFEKRFVVKPQSSSYGTVAPKRQPRRYEVLLWLAARQGGVLAGILLVLGFLLGLTLPTAGVGVWPAATLLLGVAGGAAVFMGEQAEGAFKFWGDQRLPVGWLWLRRCGLWAGVGAAAGALMLLGGLVTAAAHGVLSDEPDKLFHGVLGLPANTFGLWSVPAFLLIWPVYGFALGQLCALVWRKSAVAVVVAVMTSAGVASLWVPSLLGGGLHLLAALGAPLILLAACRLALWDWVTDRLRTRPAAARLVGGVALAWAWLAAGFAYRAVEAPGSAEPFDRAALQARLSDPEEIKAGQKLHEAVRLMKDRDNGLANPGIPAAAMAPRLPPATAAFWDQTDRVIERGWAAATPEYQNWLDRLAADPWPAQMAEGARSAPGVFIDPRDEIQGKSDAADSRKAAALLVARALEVQARGADDRALDDLVTVLALSRHLRHQGPGYAYLAGVDAEQSALAGLDHWLRRAGTQPKLLRRAVEALKGHESATAPVSEALAGEYLRFAGALEKGTVGGAHGDNEAMLSQTPWEAERSRRLTRAVFAGRRRMAESGEIVPPSDDGLFADWLPGEDGPARGRLEGLVTSSWLAGSFPATAPVQRAAQMGLCRVRGTRLQLALALYQAEHGKPAASPDELGADLPDDPYARQPFHYRVSRGERVTWQRNLPGGGVEAVREVPAGWGVLWSVGPDGGDDGGVRQWDGSANGGRDVIFLVPGGK
ncbi:MAG TPA: ABC transporter permease [Gemmataceae bacterium]|nr:ABC transporter permease [Gemmataceae bacterium]